MAAQTAENQSVPEALQGKSGAEEAAQEASKKVLSPREAYAAGDLEASKAAHAHRAAHDPLLEQHGGAGSDYIKSIVFGGLDGIITTFAIIAAVAGASLDIKVVLLMGASNLLADAISMGLGDFLSDQAEHDFVRAERAREVWEFENNPDGERQEMIDIYKKKGFTEEDATALIHIFTSKPEYKDSFIDHMMVEELGQMVPDEDDSPAMSGFITFLSFVLFGSVPLWFYLAFYAAGFEAAGAQFAISCVATALTLFLLGVAKARITKQSMWKSGGLMLLNGTLAASAAYFIGWGLEAALGLDDVCG